MHTKWKPFQLEENVSRNLPESENMTLYDYASMSSLQKMVS